MHTLNIYIYVKNKFPGITDYSLTALHLLFLVNFEEKLHT